MSVKNQQGQQIMKENNKRKTFKVKDYHINYF